jgi:glyoxylase-like metal-dependent hydrolase (beta-lactamase superfamily II)
MQQWQIGDVRITKIVEIEALGGMSFILPQAQPEAVKPLSWMVPHFMNEEGKLIASVHALVVETPTLTVVVDTCIGNDKERMPNKNWHKMQTRFLEDFRAAGFDPEKIDAVLCTHLHVDHVGWNTYWDGAAWKPTFPNARYLMAKNEFEYWESHEDDVTPHQVFLDSVAPVVEAGLVDLVETTHVVCPEVSLVPTLGHTPGHVSVRIQSQGEEALITGDFLHHPCQMAHPEWASAVDYDAEASTATRWRMLEAYAGTDNLLIGTHFAGPTAGRVVKDGGVFRLDVD